MIFHTEKSRNATKIITELTSGLSRFARYKISIQRHILIRHNEAMNKDAEGV